MSRLTRNLLCPSEARYGIELDKPSSLTITNLGPIGGILNGALELFRRDFGESQRRLGERQESCNDKCFELHDDVLSGIVKEKP